MAVPKKKNGSSSSDSTVAATTPGSETEPGADDDEMPVATPPPPFTSEPVSSYQTTGNPDLVAALAPARPGPNGKPAIPPLPPRTLAPAPGVVQPATSKLRSTAGIGSRPLATDIEAVVTYAERVNRPFEFDDLQKVWREFAVLRHKQTDNASEQIILNRDFVLTDTTVSIQLDNHIQADLFTSLLPDMLGYLRQTLSNWQLQIEHDVVMVETKKMLYSPQDKYNHLADKNPALHQLRQALGLEVDY